MKQILISLISVISLTAYLSIIIPDCIERNKEITANYCRIGYCNN